MSQSRACPCSLLDTNCVVAFGMTTQRAGYTTRGSPPAGIAALTGSVWVATGLISHLWTPGLTSGLPGVGEVIPIGCQCVFGCGPDVDPPERVVGGMLAIDCCRTSSLSVRAAICSESFFISARSATS